MIWFIICIIDILIAMNIVIILDFKYIKALKEIEKKHKELLLLHQRNYNFYNSVRKQRNNEIARRIITPKDNNCRIREQLLREIEEQIKKEKLI